MSDNSGSSQLPRVDFQSIFNDPDTDSEDENVMDEEVEYDEEEYQCLQEIVLVCHSPDGGDVEMHDNDEEVNLEFDSSAGGDGARSSPVRDRSPLPRPFSIVFNEQPSTELRARAMTRVSPRRGRAGARRGRGGVGRGRRYGGTQRAGNAWVRGDPLVQVLISDEDLPEDLRQDINNYIANRQRAGMEAKVQASEEADDFFDAEEFVWEPMDSSTNSSNKETFKAENPGPTRNFSNAYDAFRAYWDDEILTHIVTETNAYAEGIQSTRFHRDWFDTNIDEILKLFCFWMMLSIVKMPSINSCFSKHPLLKTEIFQFLFGRERYWNLNRALNFARGHQDPNDPQNVLYPIEHVLEHINTKFQETYVLHQEISIDESLIAFKGSCQFKQYAKTKSTKFGIKTQQLCESRTGYLWAFFVYIGAKTSNSPLPSSVSTVQRLIQPLLNLGHTLYMDDWFNSPRLARYLKRQGTDCVGTLRPTCRDVPRVIQTAPLAEGQFVARTSGDVRVVALQDRKRLHLISTCHDLSQVRKEARPGNPAQYRLQLVEDYNHGMGGSDKMDQMLEPYLVERKKCLKWTRKLFKRILNASIQNSRILVEASTHAKIDSLVFRLTLVQSILEKHGFDPKAMGVVSRQNALNLELRGELPHYNHNFPASRLTSRCFITKIKITDHAARNVSATNRGRRQCVLCSFLRKRSSTRFECLTCGVPLCLESCFQDFHTVPLG